MTLKGSNSYQKLTDSFDVNGQVVYLNILNISTLVRFCLSILVFKIIDKTYCGQVWLIFTRYFKGRIFLIKYMGDTMQ